MAHLLCPYLEGTRVWLDTFTREGAGLTGSVPIRGRECAPDSRLGGIIYGVVDIVIVLEVAWATRQHVDVHMWHGLPRMNAILHTIAAQCEISACQNPRGCQIAAATSQRLGDD